jgi:hypothetical protein
MKELVVLAEIESSQRITNFTALEAGIWRTVLYVTGPTLPFMKEDTFNRNPIKVSNVMIDQVEYRRFNTMNELRQRRTDDSERGGWVDGDSVVYIRFPSHRPPYVFYSHTHGALIGFTSGSPVLWENMMYRPGLLSAPKVEQSADAFSYNRMKFVSATVSIENTNGQFDDMEKLFGNDFNLYVGVLNDRAVQQQPHNLLQMVEQAGGERCVSLGKNKTDEYVSMITDQEDIEPLPSVRQIAQYYISNIVVKLDKVEFHLKDKRERLSAKIPNRQYTNVQEYANDPNKGYYHYIEDSYLDKDMQEVYGYCFGVPGVCVQGKQIEAEYGGCLDQYRFRFSSKITFVNGIPAVDRIQVKMTAGKIGNTEVDGWTTVYDRTKGWKTRAGKIYENGEITLPYEVAKQGGKHENGMNEVRVDGLFIDKTTPFEIIKDIMDKYAGYPFDDLRYYGKTENGSREIETELSPLNHEIGIMFDKSISVYEAIEKIQGGCIKGFQFQVYENKFTARVDDPRRPKIMDIHAPEIKNLNEVEVDWNAELYGTYTNIEYAHDYGEDDGRHYINKDKRLDILELHRVDKEWSVQTLLKNESAAKQKSKILLDDFESLRPLIKNIKLEGEKWHELRVYDMLDIDFRISGEERDKYPQYLIQLIEKAGDEKMVSIGDTGEYIAMINDEKETRGKRDFMKVLHCQVLRVELDIQTGITTIDVRTRNEVKQ